MEAVDPHAPAQKTKDGRNPLQRQRQLVRFETPWEAGDYGNCRPKDARDARKGKVEGVVPRQKQLSQLLIFRYNFGTNERERENGFLIPKRHQMKHLEVLILLFGTRGSNGALAGVLHG
jgi:hypothetical protein